MLCVKLLILPLVQTVTKMINGQWLIVSNYSLILATWIAFRIVNNILLLSCQVIFGLKVLTDLRKSLLRVAIVFITRQLTFVSLYCSVRYVFSLFSLCMRYHLWWIKTYMCTPNQNKNSSGDEIPERDVTYHLLCLLIYHWTTTDL